MRERIRKLRKTLDLNQTEFGNRIGVKQTTIAGYETGAKNPLDSVILSICREFNVNEEWLRTGEGEMFIQRAEEEEIADLVYDLLDPKDDSFYIAVIELLHTYRELSPQSKQVLKETAVKFLDNYKKRKGD